MNWLKVDKMEIGSFGVGGEASVGEEGEEACENSKEGNEYFSEYPIQIFCFNIF